MQLSLVLTCRYKKNIYTSTCTGYKPSMKYIF